MPEEVCETTFYDGEDPSFAKHDLDRLYGVRYSSLAHLQVYGKLENAHIYVRQIDGTPATVLLFRIEHQGVAVLNELIHLRNDEIRLFADSIFARYPQVRTITFSGIEKDERRLARPFKCVAYHSHVWLFIRGNADQYLQGLGRSTRQAIRQELRKLRSNFRSFQFRFAAKEEITEQEIRAILEFNRKKLKSKGIISSVDETEVQRMLLLSKECGMVCIATIDGRVCGGVVGYRFGENFSFQVTGYDPAYESYRLGFLVYFLSICECINRGAKAIHLGWGTQDYKFRLGGVRHDLEHLIIFRSWAHLLRAWRMALQATFEDNSIKSKRYIKDAASRHSGLASSFAKAVIASARWLRH